MKNFLSGLTRRSFVGATAGAVACLCGKASAQQAAGPDGAIPGAEKSAKSRLLGMGADLLQDDSPISAINMYLNGFHFYADDMGRQVEAHHFCTHVNEDFFQCVIYDGAAAQSRLIGVEYIVSERLFLTLPEEEKLLWHSHRHETTSGELVMPGIPAAVENAAMASLAATYGKTWHTWQIDRDPALPTGIPQLMMGFVADGQVKPELVARRDQALGIDTAQTRASRRELAASASPPEPGADAWRNGRVRQLALVETDVRNVAR